MKRPTFQKKKLNLYVNDKKGALTRLNWAMIGLLFALVSIIRANTGAEYWNELQKGSDRKYGGFNGEIAVVRGVVV